MLIYPIVPEYQIYINIRFWVPKVQNDDDEEDSIKKRKINYMHTRHLSSKGGHHGRRSRIKVSLLIYRIAGAISSAHYFEGGDGPRLVHQN